MMDVVAPRESDEPGTCRLQIDFSDFKAYALSTQDSIARCFAALDKDGNGSISVDDLVIPSTARQASYCCHM